MTFNSLLNPFHQIAGIKALGYGLLVLIVSAILALLFQTRFDGVLDIHFSASDVSLKMAITDQVVNTLTSCFIFYFIAFIAGARKTRFIDIAGTFTLARFPFMLAPLLNSTGYFSGISAQVEIAMKEGNLMDEIYSLVMPLIYALPFLLTCVIWMIALMFNAFRVSTNLKGNSLTAWFILGLVIAEILSKIILSYLT